MIEAAIPESQLARADAVLSTRHGTSGVTVLEWLKTPPARHSPTTIAETLEKIRFLKELGAHTWQLDAVPMEKQRALGKRIEARRPVKIKELKASTRTLELVFFLRVTLLELTDSLLYQTGRRVSDLVRQAYEKTTTRQARSAADYRQRLQAIKVLVGDAERSAEERLAEIGRLLRDLPGKPVMSHAASVRETLTEDNQRIRALLASLRELDFAGREAEPSLRQLALITKLHHSGASELPRSSEVPASASWRELIEDDDRKRGRGYRHRRVRQDRRSRGDAAQVALRRHTARVRVARRLAWAGFRRHSVSADLRTMATYSKSLSTKVPPQ